MKLLVADDDEVTRIALSGLLEDLGHEVVAACDGNEAWEILQSKDSPSLAILDWMMPGPDGVELCRRVRADKTQPYRYLIMFTAKDEMDDLVQGIESGADEYLRKPVDLRELRVRLVAGERILLQQDELRARATFDALTGFLNRATIIERLQRELEIVARTGAPASVLLADLDDFKRVNDTHGHGVGDEVLREACNRLAVRKRSYDELGRYGGEEFLIVLPGCSAQSAVDVANRMRAFVSSTPIETSAGPIQLSVSFGVAASTQARPMSAHDVIAAADAALYRAKRAGRNRVEGPETE
jgi:diguanylate cyclase (GGDEF)-like protein